MWRQITHVTYKNGKFQHYESERTPERMLELFAQMHFLKQAGENFTINREVDQNFNTVAYTTTRTMKDRTIDYRWEKAAD